MVDFPHPDTFGVVRHPAELSPGAEEIPQSGVGACQRVFQLEPLTDDEFWHGEKDFGRVHFLTGAHEELHAVPEDRQGAGDVCQAEISGYQIFWLCFLNVATEFDTIFIQKLL